MIGTGRRGGRPLMAMFAILAAWIGVRASFWELPFALPPPGGLFADVQTDTGVRTRRFPIVDSGRSGSFGGVEADTLQQLHEDLVAVQRGVVLPGVAGRHGVIGGSRAVLPDRAAGQLARSNLSASHQLLYAAAFAFAPTYDRLPGAAPGDRDAQRWDIVSPLSQPRSGPSRADRWAADAWLLVRQGGSGPLLASVDPASYGSNQIGAVVRYSLAPSSALQPQAYARASKALVPGGESEAAAGVSIGLARSFPLRVHGELRVTDRPGGTEVRPAAFVVTGLPRRKVGPMIEAEGYLQAGYVGGDYATGFVDGRAIVEAPVIRSERGQVAIGGGVWGGAQRGAARLDLGPTASATLSTGRTTLRGSVDYRLRVAGDAVPGDGLAVTLAASF